MMNAKPASSVVGIAVTLACLLSLPPTSAAAAQGATINVPGTSVGIAVSASVTGGSPNAVQTLVATDGSVSQRFTVPTDAQGRGAFSWTPTTHGVWMLSLDNGPNGDTGSKQVFVTAASTKTYLSAPARVKKGTAVTFTATVVPQLGSAAAAKGQIALAMGTKVLGRKALTPGQPSQAKFVLKSRDVGTTALTAVYMPEGAGGLASFDCAAACVSAPVTVTAVANDVPVSIEPDMPAAQNARTVIQVNAQAGSSVSLMAGRTKVGTQTVNQKGTATFAWVPTELGATTLTAAATSTSGVRRTARSAISVTPGDGVDAILLDPMGMRAPLSPSAPNVLADGRSVRLAVSAASGALVSLVLASGSHCTWSGMTLTATSDSGTCTLRAHSPGGWGYVSSDQVYDFALVAASRS